MVTATFRFYEELNDFLALEQRRCEFSAPCARSATTKHMIEALGVPLTSRREGVLDAIGDISLNFSAGITDLSDFGSLKVWSAGVTWSLTEKLGLQAVDLAQVRRPQGSGPCGGFKYDINRYLAAQGDRVPVHSLQDIIKSRGFHPSVQLRLQNAQEGSENGPESAPCKAEADYREQFRAAVLKTMTAQRLDAFVYPTWSNPPRLIGDLNTTPHGDNSQVFSPTTGFPAVQVPMGYTRENTLPAGITFFGKAWDEAALIRFAYAYEQATRHRRPPASTPAVR